MANRLVLAAFLLLPVAYAGKMEETVSIGAANWAARLLQTDRDHADAHTAIEVALYFDPNNELALLLTDALANNLVVDSPEHDVQDARMISILEHAISQCETAELRAISAAFLRIINPEHREARLLLAKAARDGLTIDLQQIIGRELNPTPSNSQPPQPGAAPPAIDFVALASKTLAIIFRPLEEAGNGQEEAAALLSAAVQAGQAGSKEVAQAALEYAKMLQKHADYRARLQQDYEKVDEEESSSLASSALARTAIKQRTFQQQLALSRTWSTHQEKYKSSANERLLALQQMQQDPPASQESAEPTRARGRAGRLPFDLTPRATPPKLIEPLALVVDWLALGGVDELKLARARAFISNQRSTLVVVHEGEDLIKPVARRCFNDCQKKWAATLMQAGLIEAPRQACVVILNSSNKPLAFSSAENGTKNAKHTKSKRF